MVACRRRAGNAGQGEIDRGAGQSLYFRLFAKPIHPIDGAALIHEVFEMKVLSSLKSAKNRSKDCKLVRRKGRVYVICKSDPKLKARQG